MDQDRLEHECEHALCLIVVLGLKPPHYIANLRNEVIKGDSYWWRILHKEHWFHVQCNGYILIILLLNSK